MSQPSDFFIAKPGDVVAGMELTRKFPQANYKNVDPVSLSTLYRILARVEGEKAISEVMAGEVKPTPEGGPWILRLPEALTNGLASLDNPVATKAAIAWVKTEEWQMAGATEKDVPNFVKMLLDIGKLAKRGLVEQKPLFIRISL